jgi:hypothetical protein
MSALGPSLHSPQCSIIPAVEAKAVTAWPIDTIPDRTPSPALARSWGGLCGVGHPGFVPFCASRRPNEPDDGAKGDHFRSGGAGSGAGEGGVFVALRKCSAHGRPNARHGAPRAHRLEFGGSSSAGRGRGRCRCPAGARVRPSRLPVALPCLALPRLLGFLPFSISTLPFAFVPVTNPALNPDAMIAASLIHVPRPDPETAAPAGAL